MLFNSIQTLFHNSLIGTAGGSKRSKGQTTPLLAIYIEVVVLIKAMVAAHPGDEPRLFGF